ncbi:MAG: hypothetical protein ACNS60_10700 [Candidatus Cyclobacteriaceae bacterium M2_1C_046]
MRLNIDQIPFKEIENIVKIDLFIIALGHEHRASHLAQILIKKEIRLKYCVQLVENVNKNEKETIEKLGFIIIKRSQLNEIILQNELKYILIDFSVMMKSLYSEILVLFSSSEKMKSSVLLCSYTHALFEEVVGKSHYVESIKPILLTDNKLMDDIFKTKLILSLGYERLSAIGVIENLEIDYDDVIVLINKSNDNQQHYQECMKINKEFLELLNPSQIIELNFFNFNQLTSITDSILYRLKQQKFKVIIAPLSVKTFSLYAMVQSLKYENVIFYNVTSINKEPHYKKIPNKMIEPLVYSITRDDSLSENE